MQAITLPGVVVTFNIKRFINDQFLKNRTLIMAGVH